MFKRRYDHDLEFDLTAFTGLMQTAQPPMSLQELLKIGDPYEFVETLISVIDCTSDDTYRVLPPLSRLTVAVYTYYQEVTSAGTAVFFINTDTDIITDAIDGLKTIGAPATHTTLAQVVARFRQGKVPALPRQRLAEIERLEYADSDPFDQADRLIKHINEDIMSLLRDYLVCNTNNLAIETGLW